MESSHRLACRSRDDQTFVLPPDPDVITVTTASKLSSNARLSPGNEHASSEATNAYCISVARMAPSLDRVDSVRPQPSTFQSTVADAGLLVRTNSTGTRKARQTIEDSVEERSIDEPDASLNEFSDMVAIPGESADCRMSPRKRKRSARGETSDTNFRTLQSAGGTRGAVRLMRKSSSDGISRPSAAAALPSEDVDGLDEEELGSSRTGRVACSSASDRQSTIANIHGLRMTWDESVGDTAIGASAGPKLGPSRTQAIQDEANVDDDINSVQGSGPSSSAVEAPESLVEIEENPSLIVRLKLNHAAATQRKLNRRRLALKLPIAFDLDHPKPGLLEETIKLIAKLRETDKVRLEDSFGDGQAPYQMIIDQWLEFVSIYLQFCDKTDFHEDRPAWDEYLISLEPRVRFAKDGYWGEANLHLEEWRTENPVVMSEWSRDVTCVLIEMAEWRRTLKTADVEELKRCVLGFNRNVLDWFN
jgi:hypothetical protein